MRQWIAEGRVTADSLVWRNGWPDWLNAGNVFDSLPKVATPTDKLSETPAPELLRSSSTPVSRRRKSDRTTMTAVIFLLLAALLLTGALLLAVFGTG
jgi:hypothetical protein